MLRITFQPQGTPESKQNISPIPIAIRSHAATVAFLPCASKKRRKSLADQPNDHDKLDAILASLTDLKADITACNLS